MAESKLKVAALKYENDKDTAPKVVAAGTGYVAQKILEVALANGITVYHDDSAATLLTKLDVGQEIPPELYQVVVDIYVELMKVSEEKRKALAPKKQDMGINTPPQP